MYVLKVLTTTSNLILTCVWGERMLGDLRDGGQVRHGSTERQEVVSGLSLQSGLEDETGCSTAAVLVEEVLKRREEQSWLWFRNWSCLQKAGLKSNNH